jgi:GDP-L-fucose synthase
MDTMNILITGGNGYIAQNLFIGLASKYNITKITRQNFDLTSYDETCEWFHERQFDVVIHTAISGGSRLHEDEQSVFENNMAMFNNLVANKHCFSKLISFGSGAELFHGNTPYANSKREIAKRILEYSNFYNLRIFGVFDHTELNTRFIKSNIIRYLKKEPMVIHVNKIMDFFYMKDLISLVEHYVTNKYLNQEINCSYEHKYTLQNIANFINALGSHKVPIVIQDKGKLDFYCGNSNLPIAVSGFYAGLVNTFEKLNT